jgi:signal peptidase I
MMSANSVFLVILAALIIASLALHTACVRWGLRWTNIADVSFAKAFGLFILFALLGALLAACAGLILFVLSIELSDRSTDALGIAARFLAASLAVAAIYRKPIRKSALAVVPQAAAGIAITLALICLFRPFAYEAYAIPTNAMAPTLLGEHWEGPCPRCGQPAYGAPIDSRQPFPAEGALMNCSAEHRPVYITDPPRKVIGGDRILVCKFLAPQRWDLIVFRYPGDASVNYVKRLVGLPNEELSIHDGAVWINGTKLSPPSSIQGIHYSPTIEMKGQQYSGPGSKPLKLGPDEYFVLGDFPEQSADSRMWEKGASGYPPYAVPRSHLVGVAINIYWPPSRWISFR